MQGSPAISIAEATTGGSSVLAGLCMAAGVLIITAVLVMRLWRGRRRAAAYNAKPITERVASRFGTARPADGVERMEAVMAEMQDLTRLCAAQIENRVAKLETVIRDADARIARLEALGGAPSPTPAPIAPVVPVVRPVPERRSIIGADELSQRVYALADSGLSAADVARELEEHTGKVELILALRQESRRAGTIA